MDIMFTAVDLWWKGQTILASSAFFAYAKTKQNQIILIFRQISLIILIYTTYVIQKSSKENMKYTK